MKMQTFSRLSVIILALWASIAAQISPKIVGGELVSITEYPYQVALLNNSQIVCGGTLISAEWVLTAAHCEAAKLTHVAVGVDQAAEARQLKRSIREQIIHEKYKNTGHSLASDFKYDIALLRIDPVTFSSTVQPLPFLGYGSYELPYQELVVSGFGATFPWGGGSDGELRAVKLKHVFYDREVLRKTYGNNFVDNFTAAEVVLAGSDSQENKDSCKGDSGGPLVVNISGRKFLVGVVSFGPPVCTGQVPGVYTSVAHYWEWIYAKTKVLPLPFLLPNVVYGKTRIYSAVPLSNFKFVATEGVRITVGSDYLDIEGSEGKAKVTVSYQDKDILEQYIEFFPAIVPKKLFGCSTK